MQSRENIVRIVTGVLVFLPAAIVCVLVLTRESFSVPWPAVVFYGIGVISLRWLLTAPRAGEAPKGVQEVFEGARKKLIEWARVQGVVITIFVGIVGFYVIQATVREVVEKQAASAVEGYMASQGNKDIRTSVEDKVNDQIESQLHRLEKLAEASSVAASDASADASLAGKYMKELMDEAESIEKQAVSMQNKAEETRAETEKAQEQAAKAQQASQEIRKDVEGLKSSIDAASETVQENAQEANVLLSQANRSLAEFSRKAERLEEDFREDVESKTREVLLVAAGAAYGSQTSSSLLRRLRSYTPHAGGHPIVKEAILSEVRGRYDIKVKDRIDTLIEVCRDGPARLTDVAAKDLGRLPQHAELIVPKLRELLKSLPSDQRTVVLDALGNMGPGAEEAVPELSEILGGRESLALRVSAAIALGKIGDPTAVGQLTSALSADDTRLCQASTEALAKIASQPGAGDEVVSKVVESLVSALREEDPDTQGGIVRALARLGRKARPAAGDLGEALAKMKADPARPENERVRVSLISALGEIGDPLATRVLIGVLRDRGESDRITQAAVESLSMLPEGDEPVLSALIEAMEHPSSSIRSLIAETLGKSGPKARAAVPQLKAMLKAESWEERRAAASALGDIGDPDSRSALIETLPDVDYSVNTLVLQSLRKMDEDMSTVAPGLMTKIRDADEEQRHRILGIFQLLGSDARTAAKTVKQMLSEAEEPSLQFDFLLTLAAMGDPSGPEGLVALQRHDDEGTRKNAVYCFFFEPYLLDRAGPVAVEALRDPAMSQDIKMECALHLGLMGDLARELIPDLKAILLEESDPLVRVSVCSVLAGLGQDDALDQLLAALKDCVTRGDADEDSVYAAHMALDAFRRLGSRASAAQPLIIDLMTHNRTELLDSEMSLHALVETLGYVGDEQAIPFLEDVAGAADLQSGAIMAIRRIQMKRESIASLAAALRHVDMDMRLAATSELRCRGADALPALPDLISALEDETVPTLRREAIPVLETLAVKSPEALKVLRRAASAIDSETRRHARISLARLSAKGVGAGRVK